MALVQFPVQFSFHSHSLPDSSPLSKAVQLVCAHCGRNDDIASNSIIDKLTQRCTGDPTVRSLRSLTDHDWRTMTDIPAMARVYLKHCVRQTQRGKDNVSASPSGSSENASSTMASSPSPIASSSTSPPPPIIDPFLQTLQRDFNHGLPFELTQYQSALSTLTSMGFPSNESLEALIVTDNGTKSPDLALSHLFLDSATRARKREQAKVRINKFMPIVPAADTTATAPTASALALYKEYMRGVLVNESLTKKAYDSMKNEREKRKLLKSDHMSALKELGVNDQQWDKLRKSRFSIGPQSNDSDLDCVSCMDEKKNQVVMPCGHLCLCGTCADNLVAVKGKKAKCPMCETEVQSFLKVYL